MNPRSNPLFSIIRVVSGIESRLKSSPSIITHSITFYISNMNSGSEKLTFSLKNGGKLLEQPRVHSIALKVKELQNRSFRGLFTSLSRVWPTIAALTPLHRHRQSEKIQRQSGLHETISYFNKISRPPFHNTPLTNKTQKISFMLRSILGVLLV